MFDEAYTAEGTSTECLQNFEVIQIELACLLPLSTIFPFFLSIVSMDYIDLNFQI